MPVIVLTNYNPKMNETTIISTPEAFFNALIGKDRVSFLKEAPAVEDLDENFLELIQAYLAKHPSDITGDEIDCLPESNTFPTPTLKVIGFFRSLPETLPSIRYPICV